MNNPGEGPHQNLKHSEPVDGKSPDPQGEDRRQQDWHWPLHQPGSQWLAWAEAEVATAITNFFGYYAVQLGEPGLDALATSRITHRIRVLEGTEPPPACTWKPDLRVGQFDELPFDSHSIDLVVLPRRLECSPDPHRLLREVERILRPEGHLVVLGINPWSLWGLRQGLPGWAGGRFLPAGNTLISPSSVRDWIRLLGFEPDATRYGCYAWPAVERRWLARSQRLLEQAGDRWWPVCGAAYLLRAVKRVHGMRLIGPAWRSVRARNGVAATVGQRRVGRLPRD